MISLKLFIIYILAPVIAMAFYNRKRSLQFDLNMIGEYGILCALNIPVTMLLANGVKQVITATGDEIGGYYAICSVVSSLLIVFGWEVYCGKKSADTYEEFGKTREKIAQGFDGAIVTCGKVVRNSLLPIILKMVFCLIVYSTILTQGLVNSHDATWSGPYYVGGKWELSIGRFMIGLFDTANFGRHIQPFNLLETLFICVVATEIIAYIFGEAGNKLINYLFSFLFLSNTVITCWLSYSYTTTAYAWGLLFAAVASLVLSRFYKKNDTKEMGIILAFSAVAMAVTMGTYQSFLCCILVIILFYVIFLVMTSEDANDAVKTLAGLGITCVAGFVIYEVVLHICMQTQRVSVSSYNGADSITPWLIITSLPAGLGVCYADIPLYLNGELFHVSMFRGESIFGIILLALIVMIILGIWNKEQKVKRIILVIVCLALIPIGAHITKILAPMSSSPMEMQQTASYALLVPLIIVALIPALKDIKVWNKKIVKAILAVICAVMVWGNTYSTIGDQEALRETIYTRKSLATEIYSTLISKGYTSWDSYRIAIVGNPSKSPLWVHTAIYDDANIVATTDIDEKWNDVNSWDWVYRYDLGLSLPFVDQGTYDNIRQNESVKQMGVFPNDSGIIVIDNVVVVRVS